MTSFSQMLRTIMDNRAVDAHVAIPARVETFDGTKQSVSVKPLIKRGYTDEEGKRKTESLPVINNVPVVYPGAGVYSINWPLNKGDTVLLVFSEASIDKWLALGGEVDPLDDRRNSLADAIAIPGLRSLNAPVEGGTHATALQIDAPLIHAGGTDSLALLSELNALRAAYTSHTHTHGDSAGTTAIPSTPQDTPYNGTSVLKGS